MARIRKGDMVEIVAGNDRGKRGRILRVLTSNDRVVVEGVNLRWKHMRKSQQHPQGGRLRREVAVHASNVMVYDESAETRTRISWKTVDGKKVRIARKTGAEIGTAPAKPKAEKTAKKKTKTTEMASKAKAADKSKES